MANPQKEYFDEEGNPIGRETIGERFANVDSLEARAHEGLNSKQKQATEEASYRAREEAEEIMAEERIRTLQERSLLKQAANRERAMVKQKAAKGIRGISSFARWTGVGIAATAYFWQFVCAAVSLIGFGIWGTIDTFAKETTLGKVLNTITGWLGFDFQSLFPAEYIAMGFWALATTIGMCTFIGFMLWFYFTGVRMFQTTSSTLLAALVFASFILPVSNLFPGILLWVIYINAMETASMLGNIKNIGNT